MSKLTVKEILSVKQAPLVVVNYDNYNVENLLELIPEPANNNAQRKPNNAKPTDCPTVVSDYGLSFIHCNLRSLQGLDSLIVAVLWRPERLVQLNFANNKLISILGIECVPNLKLLDLRGNQIKDMKELDTLKKFTSLQFLQLTGNPIVLHSQYRAFVIMLLQNLKKLDGNPVTRNERETAQNLKQLKAVKLTMPVLMNDNPNAKLRKPEITNIGMFK